MKSTFPKKRLAIGLALVMAFAAGGLFALAEDYVARHTTQPVAVATTRTMQSQ